MNQSEGFLQQIVVEQLAKKHDRKCFDCGIESLNRYLIQLSGQYERRHMSRTYVATKPPSTEVIGYYSISSAQVDYSQVSLKQFPRHPKEIPLPCALIGRLAVDRAYQKRGLGQFLLLHALRNVNIISDKIAITAVLIHAIDENAKRFYEQYGFLQLEESNSECDLVLGMTAIKRIFSHQT
jgi:predicted GNAT family N-acyltransferase